MLRLRMIIRTTLAAIMALIIGQPNVMQVIELREASQPYLVMEYYEHENIVAVISISA